MKGTNKAIVAFLPMLCACFLVSCKSRVETKESQNTEIKIVPSVSIDIDMDSAIDLKSDTVDDIVNAYLNSDYGRFVESHRSEGDKRLFSEALTPTQLSEEERDSAAGCYYSIWLRELFNHGLDYPVIQKVSLVSTTETGLDKVTEDKLRVDYALRLTDNNGNQFVIYLDSSLYIVGKQIVLYNGETLCCIFAIR